MLRLFLLYTVICLCSIDGMAQMTPDKTNHDFGAIDNYNNDTAFFLLRNGGGKTIYYLSTQPAEDYLVLCDTKTIEPEGVMTVGIIYYTEKKGRFNVEVPLYFSNSPEPIKLTLTGNIRSISPNAITVCPSIENSKPLNHTVPLSIVVRDKETYEQIKEADIVVLQGKKTFHCVPGFRSMAFQCNCDYGKITVNAKSKGYSPGSMKFDFNADNNTCLVLLERPVRDTIAKPNTEQTTAKKDPDPEPEFSYVPAGSAKGDFNSTDYKPNHLIFVIDISGSMKDSMKLGYLKTSVKALVSILRPQDYVTLITYASQPRIVFENKNGLSKSELCEVIDSLHAKGSSVGAEALKMAYEMAHKHYIRDGNNQIFLATDGLFNGSDISENDLYRLAKFESIRGVKCTTIAFGKNPKAIAFLSELANRGNGKSLSIKNMPFDKEILIEEVKSQSLR